MKTESILFWRLVDPGLEYPWYHLEKAGLMEKVVRDYRWDGEPTGEWLVRFTPRGVSIGRAVRSVFTEVALRDRAWGRPQ